MQLSPEEQYSISCVPPHLYSRAPSAAIHVVWSQLRIVLLSSFLYMAVLSAACMSGAMEGQKRALYPLELE